MNWASLLFLIAINHPYPFWKKLTGTIRNGIGKFFRKRMMQFTPLETEEQLDQIGLVNRTEAILKHNTSCSISQGVLDRLRAESDAINEVGVVFVLDLLAHRSLSDAVTVKFGIPHRSPQLLLIRNGRCVYHEWGFDISAAEISSAIRKQAPS